MCQVNRFTTAQDKGNRHLRDDMGHTPSQSSGHHARPMQEKVIDKSISRWIKQVWDPGSKANSWCSWASAYGD